MDNPQPKTGQAAAHRAVVTGGGRGIGRAIVDRLAADGSQVLTFGRGARPDDLPDAVYWMTADVTDPGDVRAVIAAAHEVLGSVTLLVNNAGVQVEKTVQDTNDDDWDALVGINCRGVFNMCRDLLPQMTTSGGVIVNISSTAAVAAETAMAVYNASKAFVEALTRSIAVDHGPTVRCNAVRPGWIATELTDRAFDVAREPGTAKSDAVARHPARRFGEPKDVADVVAWLASDQAQFITGQAITVDGGLTSASPIKPGLF